MKRLLAFCALLFAAALFAAPTIQNALLPNAEIVFASDKAFSQSPFVKNVAQQIIKEVETACEGNADLLQMIKEFQLNQDVASEALFSASFSAALAKGKDDVDPSKIEFMYAIQADKSFKEDVQKRMDAETAKAESDTLVKKADFRDGWMAYELAPKKEPEFKVLLAVSPDGKQLFVAPAAVLKRQLDAPPALAPYVAQYFNNDRTKGGAFTFALLVSEPLQKLMRENLDKDMEDNPDAAMALQIGSSMRALEYATVAKADGLDLRLDATFSAPEMAGMLKPMIDGFLPQAAQMIPLVMGAELPFAKTLKSYGKGNHVGITAKLVQADVDAFVKFVKDQVAAKMAEDTDIVFDGDDEDDED